MSKRVALISEHASPLCVLGGVDSGGQNVYVGQVARHLAALGYEVDVFTRRDSEFLPDVAQWINGVRIIHIRAGPAEYVRKEDMLPYMDSFTSQALRCHDAVASDFSTPQAARASAANPHISTRASTSGHRSGMAVMMTTRCHSAA